MRKQEWFEYPVEKSGADGMREGDLISACRAAQNELFYELVPADGGGYAAATGIAQRA